MAVSAFIATADGEVSFAKRHRVDEFLENVPALKDFDVHVATDMFESFAGELRNRPDDGMARVMRAVSATAGDTRDAPLVLRLACSMARADGRYTPSGVGRVREIAEILGLKTPDLGEGGNLAAHGESNGESNGESKRPFCIAVGNQKGGTGKSTTALHLAITLVKAGRKVACIDLDGHQGTLSHYLANRHAYAEKTGRKIAIPLCRRIEPFETGDREADEAEEKARLNDAFIAFADQDYVVIDTPGNQGHLTRLGHANADILITPLNDSFLDIDVLAKVDQAKREILGPSSYAAMVMQQSELRVAGGRAPIDWIVMRNRIAHLDTRNTRDMTRLLDQLAHRMGFRVHAGLSDRVVFREMFFDGLTLLDLPQGADEARLNPSHWNARREIRQLMESVNA